MISILVLEDEKVINDHITFLLKDKYKIYSCLNVDDAMDVVLSHNIDLIITDLYMSGLNGYDFLDFLKEENQIKPILVVSSITDEKLIDEAFDYNVLDFIQKPINSKTLPRQVDNIVNLFVKESMETTSETGGKFLNIDTHDFEYDDEKIHLTNKEFEVMRYLISNKHRICSRAEIYDDVWDEGHSLRVVDTIMKQLRKKINIKEEELIRTIHGSGYKYEE